MPSLDVMFFLARTTRCGLAGVAAAAAASLIPAAAAAAPAAPVSRAGPASHGNRAPLADPFSPAYGHPYRRGVLPALTRYAEMLRWARAHQISAATARNLAWNGGWHGMGVTTGHPKVYLVFYGSQWGRPGRDRHGDLTLSGDPAGAAPYLQRFLKGLGTGNERWSGVVTQYCQAVRVDARSCPRSNRQHVAYPAGGALAGVWADESTRSPRAAFAYQLGVEAVRAAAHFGNKTRKANRNAQYIIMSPTGTDPDGWLEAGFCAWHDWSGDTLQGGGPVPSRFGPVLFTNLPYLPDDGKHCSTNYVNKGRRGILDGFSMDLGHEYAETLTDNVPVTGWSVNLNEPGDLCLAIKPGKPGGAFNLKLTTGTFAMQTIWANDASHGHGGCEASHPIIRNGSPQR